MIQTYTLLGALGIFCMEDIKERKITVSTVMISGIIGICLHLIFQTESIFNMLLGTLPGLFLLLICILSKGRMGIGDAMLLMLTGLYLGLENNLYLLFYSVMLCGFWAWILLLFFRKQSNYPIPYAPFLFVSYIGMLLGRLL